MDISCAPATVGDDKRTVVNRGASRPHLRSASLLDRIAAYMPWALGQHSATDHVSHRTSGAIVDDSQQHGPTVIATLPMGRQRCTDCIGVDTACSAAESNFDEGPIRAIRAGSIRAGID